MVETSTKVKIGLFLATIVGIIVATVAIKNGNAKKA